MARSFMSRWLVRLLKLHAALLTLVLVAGLTTLVILQTDCGRDKVRDMIVSELRPMINGEVSIESIELEVFSGRVTLHGLVIVDRSKRETLTIHELDVVVGLGSLFGDMVVIERLVVADTVLHLSIDKDGNTNLDGLFIESEGESVSFAIEDLEITNLKVDVTLPDHELDVTLKELRGSVTGGESIEAKLTALSLGGTYDELPWTVTAEEGSIVLSAEHIRVPKLTATAGAAKVTTTDLDFDPRNQAMSAQLSIDVSRAALSELAEAFGIPLDPRWRADIVAEVGIKHEGDKPEWVVSIDGEVGGAQIQSDLNFTEPSSVAGDVHVQNLDPSKLVADAPTGLLSIDVTLDTKGKELATLAGDIAVDVAGSLDRLTLEKLHVGAAFSGGRVVLDVDARTDYGTGTADATVVLGDDPEIEKAHLEGNVPSLARLTDNQVRGKVNRLVLDLHGTLTALHITAKGSVTGASFDRTRLTSGTFDVDVRGFNVGAQRPPSRGRFDVSVGGLVQQGQRIGNLSAVGNFSNEGKLLDLAVVLTGNPDFDRLESNVSVTLSEGTTQIDFDDFVLTRAGLVVTGEGSNIIIFDDGRIDVGSVVLQSPAGRITAMGSLGRNRSLQVKIRDIDLADAVAELIEDNAELPPLQGSGDATLTIRRRGRRYAIAGIASMTGLSWKEGAPGIDLTATFDLDRPTVTMEVDVSVPETGAKGHIEAAIAIPGDPLDPVTWKRVKLAHFSNIDASVEGIEHRLVAALTDKPLPARGSFEATLVRSDPSADFQMTANLADVAFDKFDRINATLTGRWSKQALVTNLAVSHAGERVADATFGFDVGVIKAAALTRSQMLALPINGQLEIDSFQLARLHKAGVLTEPIGGTISAVIDLSGSMNKPRLVLSDGRADNLGVDNARVSNLTFEGNATPKSLLFTALISQNAGGLLEAQFEYVRRKRGDLVKVNVFARKFDLAFLRSFTTNPTGLLARASGTLDAKIGFAGPPTAPIGNGKLRIVGSTLLLEDGARRIDNGHLEVELHGSELIITRLTGRSGKGRFSAKGKVTLDRFSPRDLELDVAIDRFPIAARSVLVDTDLTARITARWREDIDIEVEIKRGEVRIANSGDNLQPIGPLEDLIFVDERAMAAREERVTSIPDITIRLVTSKPIHIKNKELDVDVRADITALIQDGDLVSVTGVIRSVKGQARVFGNRYRIAVGRLDFTGPIDNPYLDLQLVRDFPFATVRVAIDGTAAEPNVDLTSDVPEYDESQVLSIMLGQDPDVADDSQKGGAIAGGLIADSLRDKLPITFDVIRPYPDGVEVGHWVTRTVLVGYRYRSLTDDRGNRNEGLIEWRPWRRVVIEGRYGDGNIGNADVLFVYRF